MYELLETGTSALLSTLQGSQADQTSNFARATLYHHAFYTLFTQVQQPETLIIISLRINPPSDAILGGPINSLP